MTTSKHLPYNYKWNHGGIMSKELTDAYNALSRKIDKHQASGYSANGLLRDRFRLTEHCNPAIVGDATRTWKMSDFDLMVEYDRLGGHTWNSSIKRAGFYHQEEAEKFKEIAPDWTVFYYMQD